MNKEQLIKENAMLRQHMVDHQLAMPEEVNRKFKRGDFAAKVSGGMWRGIVKGVYSTDLTEEGYAVESIFEPGSVQIYPAKALKQVAPPPQWLLNHLNDYAAGVLCEVNPEVQAAWHAGMDEGRAQKAVAIPSECPHLIWYDDQERRPEMFSGSGAKAAQGEQS